MLMIVRYLFYGYIFYLFSLFSLFFFIINEFIFILIDFYSVIFFLPIFVSFSFSPIAYVQTKYQKQAVQIFSERGCVSIGYIISPGSKNPQEMTVSSDKESVRLVPIICYVNLEDHKSS